MKFSLHQLQVNTSPKLYNLDRLLPDFHTATEFPSMLSTEQLMYLGHANLIPLINVLRRERDGLQHTVKALRQEIDEFDALSIDCIKTMAELYGCTWTSPKPISPSQAAALPFYRRARYRQAPHTCQFGRYVAALCKPQPSLCTDSSFPNCGQTCHTCFIDKPFAGTPCIFAENTEELIDTYIGNLIGLENHYTDFIKQLSVYINRATQASQQIDFSRPRFLRWRTQDYLRRDEKAIHFQIKETTDKIQVIPHDVVFKGVAKSDPSDRFLNYKYTNARNGASFTSNHTNRVISERDYNLLHSDPDFARIWLENYNWFTYDERDARIQAALRQALTKAILG